MEMSIYRIFISGTDEDQDKVWLRAKMDQFLFPIVPAYPEKTGVLTFLPLP